MNIMLAAKAPLVIIAVLSAALCMCAALPHTSHHGHTRPKSADSASFCETLPYGSDVSNPPVLASANGFLNVTLNFSYRLDDSGRDVFCFSDNGRSAPLLLVSPGDLLVLTLSNLLAPDINFNVSLNSTANVPACGESVMIGVPVNLHFHGTYTSPACLQDDALTTVINPNSSFTYHLYFPSHHPAGLYWYHAHIHEWAESMAMGGATGTILVRGLENEHHAIAKLSQQVLVLRDRFVFNFSETTPTFQVTLNDVPIDWPEYIPATIRLQPNETQLWSIVNSAADMTFNLTVLYDNISQPLTLVALDGIAVGHPIKGGGRSTQVVYSLFLGGGARAEFMITAPQPDVRRAMLYTQSIDSGKPGIIVPNTPARPLANIILDRSAPAPSLTVPPVSAPSQRLPCDDINDMPVAGKHLIYFTEYDPVWDMRITVDDQTPVQFYEHMPAAFKVTQNTMEEWIIQNRGSQAHVFHVHQVHFVVTQINGIMILSDEQQCLDTFILPAYNNETGYNNNNNNIYPNITIRLSFMNIETGFIPFHCHILFHEDIGMMNVFEIVSAEKTMTTNTDTDKLPMMSASRR